MIVPGSSDIHCTNCGGNHFAGLQQCPARPEKEQPVKMPVSDAAKDARQEDQLRSLTSACSTNNTMDKTSVADVLNKAARLPAKGDGYTTVQRKRGSRKKTKQENQPVTPAQ